MCNLIMANDIKASLDGLETPGIVERIFDKTTKTMPKLKATLDSIYISGTYSVREAKRRRMGCFLGCMSIFFVVFLVAVLISALQYGPLAFLLILEADEGELDMNVYAGYWTGMRYVNMTSAIEILPEQKDRITARFNSILCDSWVLRDCPLIADKGSAIFTDNSILYEGTPDLKVSHDNNC